MFRSVRARLTAWYVLVFGVLLLGFSVFIYAVFSHYAYARLDHSLANVAQTAAGAIRAETGENGGDEPSATVEALNELWLPDVYVAVLKDGKVLSSNYPEGEAVLLPRAAAAAAELSGPAFATVNGFAKEGARLAIVPVNSTEGNYFVLVAQPLRDLDEQLEALRRVFYVAVPAALFIAGLGGFLLARKSLAPVVAMSNRAQHISARNLHERLPVGNANDELGRLGGVFNELLERLDQSFENMREFMADASHELRTPLAIIRGEADVALSQERGRAEYREALTVVQDESRRLSRIVDDMLALARADAGQRPLTTSEFYLNDLVDECCKAARVLAERKNILLAVEPGDDIPFRGDEDLIRRMTMNLLDNAIKYTPSGGRVAVKTALAGATASISVCDTGIGVPAEAASRVFERFYRVDKPRSRADGGSGLGLAIAKWVAEAHQGSIALASRPAEGSTFTVTLPLREG